MRRSPAALFGALREHGLRGLQRIGRLARLAAATPSSAEIGRLAQLPAGPVAAMTGRPHALFVIGSDVGGTPQTNSDLMGALSDRYDGFLLQSDGRRISLSVLRDRKLRPLRRVRLPAPIMPVPHTDESYDTIVGGWLREQAIDIVHVRHIGLHSLSLARLARRLGIPVVFSFHDYYAICPTVRLVHDDGVFDPQRCTSGVGTCRHALWPRDSAPPLDPDGIRAWRGRMQAMLTQCNALVTTSPGARERILDVFPSLRGKPFPVIGHGRDFPRFAALGHFPESGEKVRILVPGNITQSKGAGLLIEMARLDGGRKFEFHIIGKASAELRGVAGIVLHGLYRRDDFLTRAELIRPHFGAVLSIWPETWCHTLTELWSACLPVLGIDLGAVGERIRRHGGGWPVPLGGGAEVLDALWKILSDRNGFEARLVEVARWQSGAPLEESRAIMAEAYDRLFRSLLAERTT